MLFYSLHHMGAHEILKESGSRKDASMRHFTGMQLLEYLQ